MKVSKCIQIDGLTKFYGTSRGVIDLELEILRGEIFGFLGPNGAGKTTTIRVLMDFIRPSAGRASIFDFDCQRQSIDVHQLVGYLPGEFSIYPNLRGREFLRFVAELRGTVDWNYVEELASRLNSDLQRPGGDLSHGNKRKIAIIQAFMSRPKLLILDEPTNGLDPLIQQEFYKIMLEARERGATIFFSSHVLPEVQRVCDRVAMIREGRLIKTMAVTEIKARALRQVEIRFKEPVSTTDFAEFAELTHVSTEGTILRCTVLGSMDRLLKKVSQYTVVDLISHEPDLENTFMELYESP